MTVEKGNEELTTEEQLMEGLYFDQEAYALFSSFATQLKWSEKQFQAALQAIDLKFLKARFAGMLANEYSEEEMKDVVKMVTRLNAVVKEGLMLVPDALNQYLADTGLIGEATEDDIVH